MVNHFPRMANYIFGQMLVSHRQWTTLWSHRQYDGRLPKHYTTDNTVTWL